jgi:hypothetical protein
MRLLQAGEVQKLTGLSSDQLREWTSRRGLIEADAKPSGPGTRALFSWQTVLLLRIAVVLKERFHIELQSQKSLFSALSVVLGKASFPALRETALVLQPDGVFNIVPPNLLNPLFNIAFDDLRIKETNSGLIAETEYCRRTNSAIWRQHFINFCGIGPHSGAITDPEKVFTEVCIG